MNIAVIGVGGVGGYFGGKLIRGLRENPSAKIYFIASFGLVTANFKKAIGEVLQDKQYLDHVKKIISEIIALAEKEKIVLSENIIEETIEKARRFPFDTKTSFQRDFEKSSVPDERDLFGGSILRLGKQLGVKTEATANIYDSLIKQKPESGPNPTKA